MEECCASCKLFGSIQRFHKVEINGRSKLNFVLTCLQFKNKNMPRSLGKPAPKASGMAAICLTVTAAVWMTGTALPQGTPAAVPAAPAPGEWRYYSGNAGSDKYSPLDQINRDNVKNLRIAWRWKTENFGPRPEYNMEATPLMINGILYVTVGVRRDVAAIDAATGETLWMYRYDEGVRGQVAPRLNHRGVAYWTDGKGAERILYITAGYHLIELDAKTGRAMPGFGKEGIVDLYQELDRQVEKDGLIGSSSPPMIVGDIAVVGAALQPTSPTKANVPSFVRGYNIHTGKREWIFHTIPQKGEFGNETWENNSWEYTGNGGVWTTMSADPELGYVYLPVETPTNDFYGGDRPGNNLFADSLVCLEAKTGTRVWHYQLVHHDVWDYDTVAAPILLDITVGGQRIKAVAQVTKQGFTYVFDRATGKPVWPIEEKPVPASDVTGEKTSPTQPIPSKPAPFDKQEVSVDNLIDFTPELKAEAVKMVSEYKLGGVYTPPMLPKNGIKGLLKLPTATGGANWQGGAADPETGILYVASASAVMGVLEPRIPGTAAPAVAAAPRPAAGQPAGPRWFGPQGLPLVKPPYGSITAIDLNTGDTMWTIANSDAPEWMKNHPALKGITLPRTGTYEHSGLLVTKTLLFAGQGSGLFATPPGSGGPMLMCIDKKTGQILYEFKMPANQTGVPMTYMHRGKQYIVLAVGGVGLPGELIALTVD
jgi:quinoprotein glucose dehydrogenase